MNPRFTHLQAISDALNLVFIEQWHADKAIQSALKTHKQLFARERAQVVSIFYGMLRHWNVLLALNNHNAYLTKANCDRLVGIYLWFSQNHIPPGDAFAKLNAQKLAEAYAILQRDDIYKYAIPEFLLQKLQDTYPKQWEDWMFAQLQEAPCFIRVNQLKATTRETFDALDYLGFEPEYIPSQPEALRIEQPSGLFRSEPFKNGWFEQMDIGSQHVAHFLNPKPGCRVVDLCAGAGGKTLHMADLMGSTGKIIALDTELEKLQQLKLRARRAGISNIETRPITDSKVLKKLRNTADYVLVDTPCTGTGVLRRNPDIKWKLSEEQLAHCVQQQTQILKHAAQIVKPNGYLAYVTCSILPEENELQVADFQKNHPNFTCIEMRNLWPGDFDNDGFYMALFQRNAESEANTTPPRKKAE